MTAERTAADWYEAKNPTCPACIALSAAKQSASTLELLTEIRDLLVQSNQGLRGVDRRRQEHADNLVERLKGLTVQQGQADGLLDDVPEGNESVAGSAKNLDAALEEAIQNLESLDLGSLRSRAAVLRPADQVAEVEELGLRVEVTVVHRGCPCSSVGDAAEGTPRQPPSAPGAAYTPTPGGFA